MRLCDTWNIGGRIGVGTFLFLLLLSSPVFAGGAPASGKTVNGLVLETQYLINGISQSGVTDPAWPEAELRVWINSAIEDINVLAGAQESSERFTVSTGTSEYAMTSSYLYLKDVAYQTGATTFRTLSKGKFEDVGNLQKADEPAYWYEVNGKVGIYPLQDTKDATASGNTIYAIYVPLNSTLSGASAIPTPAMFDQAILYFVAKRAFAKHGKVDMAGYYDTLYNREVFVRKGIYEKERSIWDIIFPKNLTPEKGQQ